MSNELPDNAQVISATFNEQLLIGLGMIAVCVIIHGLGLFTIKRVITRESMKQRVSSLRPLSFTGSLFTLLAVFAIIVVHFVEIWLFAFLYDYLGALHSFSEALYFSTISYSTAGYSDALIHEQWRMVAALEGVMGVILLGWSTAFFVRVLGRLEGDDAEAR
ncbi:two pore domain potassium channel family protein [Qipengyuania aurantiaca]|uniref:Two pore domain potassium channel family protein n=1 Tax=Qipengyuania aurantiaca TaxID=2867233 RepID=A0ABX8ZS48_9SPHN|nr:potassium channel family protein [Qipengyuania aurantiaca]QZD90448.1 two pore domain potassium channel family protein [Qipengyuania aurantiaca]